MGRAGQGTRQHSSGGHHVTPTHNSSTRPPMHNSYSRPPMQGGYDRPPMHNRYVGPRHYQGPGPVMHSGYGHPNRHNGIGFNTLLIAVIVVMVCAVVFFLGF
jgi:hypothetical protein